MLIEKYRKFTSQIFEKKDADELKSFSQKLRLNAAQMINNAGSGHIGGACSSIDLYLMLWLCANISPDKVGFEQRDRIIASHGHSAAAIYSVLGNLGYFDIKDAIDNFRGKGSIYEGLASIKVPGVEWCNGVLGQGLSQGCGSAMAAKLKGLDYHVFVVLGDGEQAKGQLQEAREFANKYKLNRLTAIVDYNKKQSSGDLSDVMPQNIKEKYAASGWKTLEIDGHDYVEIYKALREAYFEKERPTLILANTVMGKGFCEIEGNYEYHGKMLDEAIIKREEEKLSGCKGPVIEFEKFRPVKKTSLSIKTGKPREYSKDQMVDNRSAFGNALLDIAKENKGEANYIAAVDCDLTASTKLTDFAQEFSDNFVECGIAEHNAATVAAAMSREGIVTFQAGFAVFVIDEVYSQIRIGDMHNSKVKLICTHCGLDVGEDGKTHQCTDYISLLSNLKEMKIIIPADPNQTDRAIRYAAAQDTAAAVIMGRSKMNAVTDENGKEFFAGGYSFEYGKGDLLRQGGDAAIITYGNMVPYALKASEILKKSGLSISVLNISFPLKLDEQKIKEAADTGVIVIYEDHNQNTGLGNIIASYLMEKGLHCRFIKMGVKKIGYSASPEYNYKKQNLDTQSLVDVLTKACSK